MIKRTARSLLATLIVVVAAAPSAGQERREVPPARTYGEPASSDDQTAIQALVERYKDAWSRQDTAAFVALHTEDTEWINAYARIFRGTAALADFIENRLFPAFDSDVSRQEIANMRMISTRYLGDDAAVVHMYTEGQRGASRNAGENVRRTHLHLVLAKQDGVWRIVHTVIMDAR